MKKILCVIVIAFLIVQEFAFCTIANAEPILSNPDEEQLVQSSEIQNTEQADHIESSPLEQTMGQSAEALPSITSFDNSANTLPSPQLNYRLSNMVDSTSGALTYEYGIEVPQGRNGLTPSVRIAYNSQNTEQSTLLGYGWKIDGIPEISRINRSGIDQLYGQPIENWDLRSSLSGELAFQGSNQFGSKIDDGGHLTFGYDSNNDSFTTIDKLGTTYIFGGDTNAKQSDPNNPNAIYRWVVTSIKDSNGNTINFTYTKNNGQIYPSEITYADVYSIKFLTESRDDVATDYKTGFSVRTLYRVSSIETFFDGNTIRKYHLDYTTGDNQKRSLLKSIHIETNTKSYPAFDFSYTKSDTPNWSRSNWNFPDDTHLGDGRSMALDANGDGYTDILTAYQDMDGSIIKHAYINDRNGGWDESTSYLPPDIFAYYESSEKIIPTGYLSLDVNGDLLPDLIQSYRFGAHPTTNNVYLNTGSGWQYTYDYKSPITITWNNYGEILNDLVIADLNGDGVQDMSRSTEHSQYGLDVGTYFGNTGRADGFRKTSQSWLIKSNLIGTRSGYADLNGDGIDDYLDDAVNTSDWRCTSDANIAKLSNGNASFFDASNFASPHSLCSYLDNNWYNASIADWGGRIVDINTDGLPDLVYATNFYNGKNSLATYLNTGDGWSLSNKWTLPSHLLLSSREGTIGGVIDINGDGLPEVYSGGLIYTNTSSVRTDLLSRIDYPSGGYALIRYQPSSRYKDDNGNQLNPHLPIIINTVYKVETIEPMQGTRNEDIYHYAEGTFYYDRDRLSEKKFAGFGKVRRLDSQNNVIISYYHTGMNRDNSYGDYDDHEPAKIGKMYRQEVYNASGTIYTADFYRWNTLTIGTHTTAVSLGYTMHQDINGQIGHKDTAVSYVYDTNTRNLTMQVDHGRVEGQNNGGFSDIPGENDISDTKITKYEYAVNTSGNSYRLSRFIIQDNVGNELKNMSMYYDNRYYLGQMTVGNLTEQRVTTPAGAVKKLKSYTDYGLVITESNENGYLTTYEYDTYFLFPASITNSLGHKTKSKFNYAIGKPISVVDANGYTRETDYDDLGRPIEERSTDRENINTLSVRSQYFYDDTPNALRIQNTIFSSPTNFITHITYYDGLGRPIQSRTQYDNNGNFQVSDTVYNSLGQVKITTLPYLSTGQARTAKNTESKYEIQYSYDPLGRITLTRNVLGAISSLYKNWQTTKTDQNGNARDFFTDAYGRLIQVNEYPNANTVYSTVYRYDLVGNLIQLTDAHGNIRSFDYDIIGRRMRSEDLHAPGDTTFGVYQYTYDPLGNISIKKDPNGNLANYTYDLGGRIQSIMYEKVGSDETKRINYFYDTCGKGFLCSAEQPEEDVTTKYAYFMDGLIQKESKNINGKMYDTEYGYDQIGNMLFTKQPNGKFIRYAYDALTRPNSVTWDGTTIVNSMTYSIHGALSQITLGNGLIQTNSYDPSKLYRLTQKQALNPSNNTYPQLQNYTYDAVGNITRIVDSSNTQSAKTLEYTYDTLNRLTKAKGINSEQTFTYDALGNILTVYNSELPLPNTYSYMYDGSGYANPHAVTKKVNQINQVNQVNQVVANQVHPDSALSEPFLGPNISDTAEYAPTVKIEDIIEPAQVEYEKVKQGNLDTKSDFHVLDLPPIVYAASTAPKPIIKPASGTYTAPLNITISSSLASAKIYYTTDGSTPSPSANLYALPFALSLSATVKAIAVKNGYANSPVSIYTYTLKNPLPTISQATGIYIGDQSITISSPIEGAKVYYTTNGSTPTTSSNRYSAPIVVSKSTTIKAMAVKSGLSNSDIASASITIKVPLPTISPSGGNMIGEQLITLGNASSGVKMNYTTNGTAPTTSSKLYESPFLLAKSATVKVLATKAGCTNSSILTQSYTLAVPTPVILPVTGNYFKTQTVVISNPLTGAKTYFTTDGRTPTSSSTLYTAPFEVNTSTTIRALSINTGMTNSSIGSSIISILPNQTEMTYDNNGNLIKEEGIKTADYTFDYNNRLIESTTIAPDMMKYTSTYKYDTNGQRVLLDIKKISPGGKILEHTFTYYPSKNFSETYSSDGILVRRTEHIFAPTGGSGDLLVATIAGGNEPIIYFHLNDHLGSTKVTTDASGVIQELNDYYPYGGLQTRTSLLEERKFIGQYFDTTTDLNYFGARYYDSTYGRFLSQDSVFWDFTSAWLADPQIQNAYSYARNNPLNITDPLGLIPTLEEAATLSQVLYNTGHEGEGLIGGWELKDLFDGKFFGIKSNLLIGSYRRQLEDGQYEYAFVSRGTDPKNGSDIKNNFLQPFGSSRDARAPIRAFQLNLLGDDAEVTFVGHSKGGAEATILALATNRNAIVFDPSVANYSAYISKKLVKNYTHVVNVQVVRGEIISETEGKFYKPFGVITYYPSQYKPPVGVIPNPYYMIKSMIINHDIQSMINAIRDASKTGYEIHFNQ